MEHLFCMDAAQRLTQAKAYRINCGLKGILTQGTLFDAADQKSESSERKSGMIGQDTIRLLRECDAGVKMGVEAIDEVLGYVRSGDLGSCLKDCQEEHIRLEDEIQDLLDRYHDDGKEPNLMAKGMSWVKTNVKLAMDDSDRTIAGLMTDGCNMGVKSLNQYLNQYGAAEEKAKDITKKLIKIEEKLVKEIRDFL